MGGLLVGSTGLQTQRATARQPAVASQYGDAEHHVLLSTQEHASTGNLPQVRNLRKVLFRTGLNLNVKMRINMMEEPLPCTALRSVHGSGERRGASGYALPRKNAGTG
jgi:hypothetical protein